MKMLRFIVVASMAALSGTANAAVRYSFTGTAIDGGSLRDVGFPVSGGFSVVLPDFVGSGITYASSTASGSISYQTESCNISVGTDCVVSLTTDGLDGPTLFLEAFSGGFNSSAYIFASDAFSQFGTFTTIGGNVGTLIVSDPAAAVPEPASWALMVGGFGLLGRALRRQRRVSVTFA